MLNKRAGENGRNVMAKCEQRLYNRTDRDKTSFSISFYTEE